MLKRGAKILLSALVVAWAAIAPTPLLAHGGGVIFIPVYVPMVLPRAAVGSYDRYHRIAVVSGLGNGVTLVHPDFLFTHSGRFSFNNWNLDDYVEQTVAGYLKQRFDVVPVEADRAAIAVLRNGPLDNTKAEVNAVLSRIPQKGIDAFVVIRPDLESYTPGQQGVILNEGGGGLFIHPPPSVSANYEIDVIDAHSYALVSKSYARARVHDGLLVSFATLPASPAAVSESDTPTPAQASAIQASVQGLLDNSLVETLRALSFGVNLPGGAGKDAPPKPRVDPYPGMKTVAVISAVGDRVTVSQDGNNTELPIQGWNVDASIEAHARAALSPRFTVKDVPVNRAALADASLFDSQGGFQPNFPGLTPTTDVDLYVLILADPSSVWHGKAKGFGIEQRSGPETAVFVNYAVAVLDAHTLRVLVFSQGYAAHDSNSPKPFADVNNSLWPSLDGMTQDQAVAIRDAAATLMDGSVEETLLHLGLNSAALSQGGAR